LSRDQIYDNFALVTQTLGGAALNANAPDVDLRDSVCDCLALLGNAALIAAYIPEGVTLRIAAPRSGIRPEQLAEIEEHLKTYSQGDPSFFFVVGDLEVLGCWIREKVFKKNGATVNEQIAVTGYSALCFRGIPSPDNQQFFISLHSLSTAALLHRFVQSHTRLFRPFSPRVSEDYWNQGSHPNGMKGSLILPWRTGVLRTVTLAYDLRKSTFCMENADQLDSYATWVDQLVQILMGLGHHFGGVFDKFTGDGGLVHFVEEQCRRVIGLSSLDAAVETAIAMQDATTRHLEHLRKFLFLNSRRLGACIGVGVGDTRWSLDHRHNPIIVGRGVVHACRLMNDADAGTIRLTNLAYQGLSSPHQKLFTEEQFESKEHPAAMEVTAWLMVLTNRPEVASRSSSVVDKVCQTVYERDGEAQEQRVAR
jgi:class 3 adenylate cyclase